MANQLWRVSQMSPAEKGERIKQRCPACGRELRIPPEFVGQKVACKFCDHELVVGMEEKPADRGLSFAGSGTAFEIERSWKSPYDEEARYTIIRHPLKQGLRGFTLAVECHGPSQVHVAGILVKTKKAVRLSRVRPGEVKIVPLDDVYRVYMWLDKRSNATVKIIVARSV